MHIGRAFFYRAGGRALQVISLHCALPPPLQWQQEPSAWSIWRKVCVTVGGFNFFEPVLQANCTQYDGHGDVRGGQLASLRTSQLAALHRALLHRGVEVGVDNACSLLRMADCLGYAALERFIRAWYGRVATAAERSAARRRDQAQRTFTAAVQAARSKYRSAKEAAEARYRREVRAAERKRDEAIATAKRKAESAESKAKRRRDSSKAYLYHCPT